jgi:hypothetical protein
VFFIRLLPRIESNVTATKHKEKRRKNGKKSKIKNMNLNINAIIDKTYNVICVSFGTI